MPVVVVGLNHKTAPVSLLERLAIPDERLSKALHQLGTYEHVLEGAVLSTCNRIEVYAAVGKFHGGAQNLRNFLAEFGHVAPEDFSDHLYTYHDEGAVRHLFRVASGIDSMVVGESEILGQVRRAFARASEEGMVGHVLGAAFRRALRSGKRARAETAIGRNPASISSAAVGLARRAYADSLHGRAVAIVGAGKMGRLAVKALKDAGAGNVTVVNRRPERAHALAGAFGIEPRPLDDLEDVLAASDILISSTTAPSTIVQADVVRRALDRRASADPLFVIDIAVPRDVDPAVGELPGVVLRDIEDLRGVVEATRGSRTGEISKVEALISEELDRFLAWERASESEPTAAALVARAEAIRTEEVERLGARLDALGPAERDAVELLSRRIIAKLLHAPLKNLKERAGSKQGHVHLDVLRSLFELDDE